MVIEMIPGINTLYNILKRHIDRGNNVLDQRKSLARELLQNCNEWSAALLATFGRIMYKWESDGRQAALKEIESQIHDFTKLDYSSLKDQSPILLFLREDVRFEPFVCACSSFYESALGVKRLIWGQIEKSPGEYVSSDDVGVEEMVKLWHAEVERMLEKVRNEFRKIQTITPQ